MKPWFCSTCDESLQYEDIPLTVYMLNGRTLKQMDKRVVSSFNVSRINLRMIGVNQQHFLNWGKLIVNQHFNPCPNRWVFETSLFYTYHKFFDYLMRVDPSDGFIIAEDDVELLDPDELRREYACALKNELSFLYMINNYPMCTYAFGTQLFYIKRSTMVRFLKESSWAMCKKPVDIYLAEYFDYPLKKTQISFAEHIGRRLNHFEIEERLILSQAWLTD